MTADRAELQQLEAAATPGPWRWSNSGGRNVRLLNDRSEFAMTFQRMGMQDAQPCFPEGGFMRAAGKGNLNDFPNAQLIVAARNALPSLLADLDAAEKRLAGAEKLAAPQMRGYDGFLHLPNDDDPVACYVQGYNACIDDLRHTLGQSAGGGS